MLTPRRRRAVYVSCTALVAAVVVVAVLGRRRPARPRPHAPVWSLPNLTVDNVLERCDDALAAADVLYRVVGRPHFNYLDVLAVRARDRRCLAASNEWLSLLRRPYYAGWGPGVRRRLHYGPVVELYARLAQEDAGAATVVDEAATPLITSFSRGTVHGFTDFWLILAAWCDREATGRANRTLLVYDGSDRGMLDVVRAATDAGVLDGTRLRFLRPDVTYRFRSLEVLPSPAHTYWGAPVLARRVSDFVHRHFVRPDATPPGRAVAVLKTRGGLTGQGVLAGDAVAKILRRHDAVLLDGAALGEIGLINALARAEIFVTSWGTAVMKNFVYLGENCTDIFVYHTKDFASQFSSGFSRFRNAAIHYAAVEDTFPPAVPTTTNS